MVFLSKRYRMDKKIEDGAVESWNGLDLTLDRPVTIRITDIETEIGQRVRMQAQALSRLEHPSLLHIYDSISTSTQFAIITESLPSRNLAQDLQERGRFSAYEAVQIVIQVGEGLASLHQAGFAHGGVEAHHISLREDRTPLITVGPPTGDAVKIPARPSNDISSLGRLCHLLIVGTTPTIDVHGRIAIHPTIPSSLRPILEKALSDQAPWNNSFAMILAFQSVVHELKTLEFQAGIAKASYLESEKTWFAPIFAILSAAVLIIGIGLLLAKTNLAPSLVENVKQVVSRDKSPDQQINTTVLPSLEDLSRNEPPPKSERLTIIDIIDFDPEGDDRLEHPDKIKRINDGDASRGWNTARYNSRNFGGLKSGVGLIIKLSKNHEIDLIEVGATAINWGFELYAVNESPGSLLEWSWGSPITSLVELKGITKVNFTDLTGSTLLLWITDLGNSLPVGGHRVSIHDISIYGRPVSN